MIKHEDWGSAMFYQHLNDIGLLKLMKPLTFNKYVQKVSLPELNEDFLRDGWHSDWMGFNIL